MALRTMKPAGLSEVMKLAQKVEGNGVLYGTKAFGIKNLNSNVSFKIMPKIVRIVQGGKGRRYGQRLLSNLKVGVPNVGY